MFKSLFQWIAQPLSDYMDLSGKKPSIAVTPYDGHRVTMFRPSNFDEYIGQSKAKDMIQNTYIKAVKERGITMPHVLLHGPAGFGKTTLARIIANELQVPFQEIVTSTLKDTSEIISKIEYVDGGVLFLDEIHGIERGVAESIYSIMEDFTYNGISVRPFTLVGATTELGELIRTRKPFVDRFKIQVELGDYTLNELVILLNQYRKMNFPLDILPDVCYDTIAGNCRMTPRKAISLLDQCVYLKGNVKKMLSNSDIILQGYTTRDLEILKWLFERPVNTKGVRVGAGVSLICTYLGTSEANYTEIIEPYLIKTKVIERTGQGRKITLLGESKIVELEKAKESV